MPHLQKNYFIFRLCGYHWKNINHYVPIPYAVSIITQRTLIHANKNVFHLKEINNIHLLRTDFHVRFTFAILPLRCYLYQDRTNYVRLVKRLSVYSHKSTIGKVCHNKIAVMSRSDSLVF